ALGMRQQRPDVAREETGQVPASSQCDEGSEKVERVLDDPFGGNGYDLRVFHRGVLPFLGCRAIARPVPLPASQPAGSVGIGTSCAGMPGVVRATGVRVLR